MYSAGALFSGIGGFCLGFERAGIRTKWAVEFDQSAVNTYEHNLDAHVIKDGGVPSSIEDIDVLKSALDPVDVLHAGFPCQSFSVAGNKRGFDDPRGRLFFQIGRIVREFGENKPAIIILENSPNILTGNNGAWFKTVENELRSLGYWFRTTNAAILDTYQLTASPQRRKRLFCIALSTDHFRNGRIDFPTAIEAPEKDLSEFIDFEVRPENAKHYISDENKYGKMLAEVSDDLRRIYQVRKYIVRKSPPDLCPTLTANMGMGGHNVPFIRDKKGFRKLTVNECLAIQGFPSTFRFPDSVSNAQRYKQVGNSVSPEIAHLIGEAVRQKLDERQM